ncbi:MAG TPA: hypothetical protein VK483_17375, partial [Chitinophagaceae bacterium]|nr:hypothetical protein [Chitinophagaceae bacterium]
MRKQKAMQIYFKKRKPCLLRQAQDDRAIYFHGINLLRTHLHLKRQTEIIKIISFARVLRTAIP